MDWALAIELNRTALLRVVAGLFAMAGLAPGSADTETLASVTLPRHVRSALLRVLRKSEAALRRLVVIAVHTMARDGRLTASANQTSALPAALQKGTTVHIPAFPLLDPLKPLRFGPVRIPMLGIPRISVPGITDPVFIETKNPAPEDILDAGRLCLRLEAVRRALGDLPRQARRLARWQQRNEGRARSKRFSTLRPGRPPGYRTRPVHAIDDILNECHALARDALSGESSRSSATGPPRA